MIEDIKTLDEIFASFRHTEGDSFEHSRKACDRQYLVTANEETPVILRKGSDQPSGPQEVNNELDQTPHILTQDPDVQRTCASLRMTSEAIILENFITTLFPIEKELAELKEQALYKKKLSDFKFKFVQKKCYRTYKKEEITPDFKNPKMDKMPIGKFIDYVLSLKDNMPAIKHIAYKVHFDPSHNIFKMPKKLDFDNLIGDKFEKKDGAMEANYCIFCHNQEKDSCRTGLHEKTNPLGNKLDGCPLDQKISEMNYLYSEGHPIAALAVTMIDNPLVAVTGHRVCNDCMKSCIFQKQEPVDIPCIETDMVQDVLRLPYGAEIYYLLTRWNPLCDLRAKEQSPGHALVVGLGPAGFALSYYLLREGHKVTAIDSMDIKPLNKAYFEPIKDWNKLVGKYEPQGFGGVCEYGITDRWDKNNLLLIRMILERFEGFEIRGNTKLISRHPEGVSFEPEQKACDRKELISQTASLGQAPHILTQDPDGRSTLLPQDDENLQSQGLNARLARLRMTDYDHIALCIGAGSPIKPDIKNTDALGIISAFEFLMERNMANCHPEKVSFEPEQKACDRKELISQTASLGQAPHILTQDPDGRSTLLPQDDENLQSQGLNALLAEIRMTNSPVLIIGAGLTAMDCAMEAIKYSDDVSIIYRKSMRECPAYRENHDELQIVIDLGVKFIENTELKSIEIDDDGHVVSINGNIKASQIIYAFSTYDNAIPGISKYKDKISYLGDVNPTYAGTVVKAIASAKNMYGKISKKLV